MKNLLLILPGGDGTWRRDFVPGQTCRRRPFVGDFPDPSIIGDGKGLWFAYGTSAGGHNVPVVVSNDVRSWSSPQESLPNVGGWVDMNVPAPRIWAPDLVRNVRYFPDSYTEAAKSRGRHCIGVATSRSPTGPFSAHDSPLACNDAGGGLIDAAGYDDGTNRWVVWKVDGSALGGATNCIGGGTSDVYISTAIQIQRMQRDGVTPAGAPKTIFDNNGAGDDGIVEAPSLARAGDGFVLFYSSNCYASDNYDIKYAWSSTVDGDYQRKGTLLTTTMTNNGIYGPGGLDVDWNGRTAVFHGRTAPRGARPVRGHCLRRSSPSMDRTSGCSDDYYWEHIVRGWL
ncbi:glycoside hydrolase family 43 protein [Apiospora hydei]|uniref:Glycoside hydrolase family 43 protein n=1 Tax=Apiospora hydei TaxID=1337664 RepID=A0ABR1XDJ3_9PEZI